MEINMFDILDVNFGSTIIGSVQGGRRPAIVMQNDMGNKFSSTLIVIPLSSELKKSYLPTHTILHKDNENCLKCDSMAMAEQVRVISKNSVISKIGCVKNKVVQQQVIATYIANVTGVNKYKEGVC